MIESNDNNLVVGMGTGWEKNTSTKAGPMGEPIAKKAFELAIDQKAPLIFLSGNVGKDKKGGEETMPEADRMQNYVHGLIAKALKNGNNDISIPEIYTDTDLENIEQGFIPSTSTSKNIQNLIQFIKNREKDGLPIPDTIQVVALDVHMPRVLAIMRQAFTKAGLPQIKITPHEIVGKGLYSEKNAQTRLQNETHFKIWTKISHLWSMLNGDAGIGGGKNKK